MDSDRFWLLFWAICGTTMLGTVGLVTSCVGRTQDTTAAIIQDAVKHGVDPMIAKCAMILDSKAAGIGPNETLICLNVSKK